MYANQRWWAYIGASPQSHFNWQSCLHPDDRSTAEKLRPEHVETGKAALLRYRLRRADGCYFWYEARAEIVHDELSGELLWVGTCTNINDHVEATRALSASQQHLQAIVANAPLKLWAFDQEGTLTMAVGQGLPQLWAIPSQNIGKNAFQINAGRPDILSSVRRALNGETFYSQHESNGVFFENHFSPLRDATGKQIGVSGISIDITDSKHTQVIAQQTRRLASLVEIQREVAAAAHDLELTMQVIVERVTLLTQSDGAVVQLLDNDDLIFRAASGPLSTHLGLHIPVEGSLSGLCVTRNEGFICHDTHTDPRANAKAVAKTQIRSMVVVPLTRHKEVIGIVTSYSRSPRAFTDLQLCSLQLLSGLVSVALEQAEALAAKNIAITQLKATKKHLIEARRQAEQAACSKAEFLANMSHEIRTPLSGILGIADLFLETKLTEQQLQYAKIVQSSGTGLLAVINDILDFSKIEAGKLLIERASFELVHLVEGRAALLASGAYDKGLHLVTIINPALPRYFVGDAARIGQVLLNLVGNAIKFTERGHVLVHVTAKASADPGGPMWVDFAVRDSGIGLSAQAQENLFQAFTQADGTTARKYGGTGLGLSISRRLVESMGGNIQVRSEEGHGSVFHFGLPLKIDTARCNGPHFESTRFAEVPVLVVDNDAVASDALCQYLRGWGMAVTAVSSSRVALRKLRAGARRSHFYRLVFIATNMPQSGSQPLEQQIQAEASLRRPKLICTAPSNELAGIHGPQGGSYFTYLSAPMRQKDLWDAVSRALGVNIVLRDDPPAETVGRPLLVDDTQRVLVAEDNDVNQLLICSMIQNLGYTVDVVANGREALNALSMRPYHLVLMDCQMPEMDGYEATQVIRALEREHGGHLPIVALTAHALREDARKCLDAGMDAYVAKPMRKQQLVEVLAKWVCSADPSPALSSGALRQARRPLRARVNAACAAGFMHDNSA